MRRPQKFWSYAGGFLVVTVLLMAWTIYANRSYGVGKKIQDIGLTCCGDDMYQNFSWLDHKRQPVGEYFKQRGKRAAHFTGGIVPISSDPAQAGWWHVWVEDGKYSSLIEERKLSDPKIREDITTLKSSGLAKMLANAKGDWRIMTETGHDVYPMMPFSGDIEVNPEHVVGWRLKLKVKDDVIVSSERHIGMYID